MGKGMILGIDFSMDYAQIAYLDNDGNPQSVSVGTEDNYMIPAVVCYNSELNEWSAGDEAVNKGRLEKSKVYKNLPEIFNEDSENDADEAKKAVSTFMSYLIKLAVNYSNGRLIKNILVTVNQVNPQVIRGLLEVFTELGYNEKDIKVISHSESFVYYVLNQNKDIWINNVLFLQLDKHEFSCRRLNVIKGRQPHVADVRMTDLSNLFTMDLVTREPLGADEILSEFLEEQLKKHVVSGVFLSGEGFYVDGWQKTLSVLCRNRRVFKGSNLIVKGAAYGAREFFYVPVLDKYLISCKGRTRVKIVMAVKYKEHDSYITLSNIGEYWHQAKSKAECIMEKPTEASFEIQDIMNHANESFKIDLKDFPKRPPNTTRLEINFRYLSENSFEIEIKDLGFGEFFKSSGMSVKKEITL
nr:DUF5716 family protein [uncultured Eubacterium sp.]